MRAIACWTIILVCCASLAAGAVREGRVVVVVAGNLSIRDIADPGFSTLDCLFRSGSAGLMNVRTARPTKDVEPTDRPGMESGCLTVGAGAMAAGGAEVRRATNSYANVGGISTGDLYTCRTGRGFGQAQVLHPEIVKIQRICESSAYRARPGALGSALRASGIKTAVIGNSDMPGESHREAVAIAMDETGIVDYGDVDSPNLALSDQSSPYGVRANPDALLRGFYESRFIVINFGDTLRADAFADLCTDEQAALIRNRAAGHLDEFLSRLIQRLDFGKDLLIVLAPSPRAVSDIEEERLAPIIIKGRGFGGGILTSPSTRRAGIVTLSDIAPTILAFFGLEAAPGMVGRPIANLPRGGVRQALLTMNMRASSQAQQQPTMRGASVAQSVVVVLVTALILLNAGPRLRIAGAWAALIPAALPLAMLYLPSFYSGGLTGAVIWLILLTAVIIGLCVRGLSPPGRALAWLCAANVLSLAVDLLRGAPLIRSSIAGYNLVEGARYYGIGNELMGTMLGAMFVGTGIMLAARGPRRNRGVVAALIYAAVFALMGASFLGAEVGGAMAIVPAAAVALLSRRGWKPSVRSTALIAALTIVTTVALFAFDAMRGGASQSHIGRAVGTASDGDAMGLLLIVQRKMALNFMLLSTSLWSRLLVLSLAASGTLFFWAKRKLGRSFLAREEAAAAVGACVGVVAAFLFNDSGVVAAATCVVFLWMMLVVKIRLNV